jgi:cell division protein FtsB
MSKIIKLLNEAQRGLSPSEARGTVPVTLWLIGLILCIVLFTNLGLTLKLFTMMKTYTSANALQINTFSTDFEKLNANLSNLSLRIQDTNTRVTQLEKDSEIQTTAIENLTKAKNTLFKRVNELEANLTVK